MEQNEKIEMPREPLSSVYADAKTSLTKAVRNVMQAFPLPVFMFESLLDGLLCDIRAEAKWSFPVICRSTKETWRTKSVRCRKHTKRRRRNSYGSLKNRMALRKHREKLISMMSRR